MRFNSKFVLLFALMLLIVPCVTVFAAEVVDQKQEHRDTVRQILAMASFGQEFTPTMSPLDAVELYIETMNSFGDDTITVRIRALTIGGTVLGTASQLLTEGFDGWVKFDFSSISLTPGSLYVIEVSATTKTFGWGGTQSNLYPGGRLITTGTPSPTTDAMFRTYSGKEEAIVGGEVVPVDKLAILTPYLIMAIVILTTTTVIIKKRKS